MKQYNISRGTSFYAIGLSYKKADAVIRGHFSLNEEAKLLLLELELMDAVHIWN